MEVNQSIYNQLLTVIVLVYNLYILSKLIKIKNNIHRFQTFCKYTLLLRNLCNMILKIYLNMFFIIFCLYNESIWNKLILKTRKTELENILHRMHVNFPEYNKNNRHILRLCLYYFLLYFFYIKILLKVFLIYNYYWKLVVIYSCNIQKLYVRI